MKTTAIIAAACVANASAFAPSSTSARAATELSAEKKPVFSRIFDMDLFAPNAEVNDYGARNKKNLSTGKLGNNSYVPSGLSKADYEKVRAAEESKKQSNYARNVAKAGKFLDYTKFYLDRGTDVNEDWNKSPTKGHRMAKTKYDWSGEKNDAPSWVKAFGKK